jgi:3-oxoadipate enol-lactonase
MPTAPIRDIDIYYEESGSGDPLILIMGISGDLQAWALQVPALSRHFRVITLDNRGAGRTSAPDKPYSIAGMAEDVAGLMDHLGIARAHVLGFSMGGYVAQELALKHPTKVDKLILLATAPYIDGYGENTIKSWINVRRSNMSRDQVQRLTALWLYGADLFDDRERFERAILTGVANPYAQQDHAFIRQAQAVLGFDARDRLPNLKQDTLIVCGEEDILVPPRNSERLGALIPKSRLVRLPGGHIGCIEHPAEYNAAFLEFLGAAVPA